MTGPGIVRVEVGTNVCFQCLSGDPGTVNPNTTWTIDSAKSISAEGVVTDGVLLFFNLADEFTTVVRPLQCSIPGGSNYELFVSILGEPLPIVRHYSVCSSEHVPLLLQYLSHQL